MREIQQAFLDGMEELFQIMFTEEVTYSPLDEENTVTNIYGETHDKVYGEAIKLIAKVTTNFTKDSLPPNVKLDVSAIFRVPTQQLIRNNLIAFIQSDLDTLQKGKFSYKGEEYLITYVHPTTLVDDMWQFYDFYAYIDKKQVI